MTLQEKLRTILKNFDSRPKPELARQLAALLKVHDGKELLQSIEKALGGTLSEGDLLKVEALALLVESPSDPGDFGGDFGAPAPGAG